MTKTSAAVTGAVGALLLSACASAPEEPEPAPPPPPPPVVEAPPPPPPEPEPAPEPEPEPEPIIEAVGEWSVSAVSVRTLGKAESVAARLVAQGRGNVEVREVTLDDGTWYRVLITGFLDQADATPVAAELDASEEYRGAWVLPPSLGF